VRGFRSVTAIPCRLPQNVTHRCSLEFRTRACWARKTVYGAVFVPAKTVQENSLRGLALKLALLRWLAQGIAGASATQKLGMDALIDAHIG